MAEGHAGVVRVEPDGDAVAATLRRAADGSEFVLKIEFGGEFPADPPGYKFVNPDTGTDDGAEFWPDGGGSAFKTGGNPRWICLPCTPEYMSYHPEYLYDPCADTVSAVVYGILYHLDGAGSRA